MAVRVEVADGVATVTLDRPESFNTIDLAMAEGLREAVSSLRGARVVRLRASGRAFCGGGDLAAFDAAPVMADYVESVAGALHEALLALWELEAVVVAEVQGVAAGAGVPLAMAADLVLASEDARFDLAYARVGLTPDGSSSLLAASIGLHRALRLFLLSPSITAREAADIGLVAEVVAADALAGRVDEVVAALAAGPLDALIAGRALLRRRATPDPAAALAAETAAIVTQAAGADAAEGIRAFLDKRRPRFGGRAAT